MKRKIYNYFYNLLIAIDQLFNTILGGYPDETVSSRAGKQKDKKLWAKLLCWMLNKIDPNHCKDSIEEDEGKSG